MTQQPQYQAPQYQAPQYQQYNPTPSAGGPFDGAIDADVLNRPLYGASFGQAVKRFFKNYGNFSGRASLSEFWWISLFMLPVSFVMTLVLVGAMLLVVAAFAAESWASLPLILLAVVLALVFLVAYLAILIPGISITWRRLQDADFSGFLYFLVFVPYVGGIIIIILTLMPSKVSGRRYDAAL